MAWTLLANGVEQSGDGGGANPRGTFRRKFVNERGNDILVQVTPGIYSTSIHIYGPTSRSTNILTCMESRELLNALRAALTDATPACPYCGATEGLRVKSDGGGYIPPEYTCEACFKGQDDGPCFDDLPAASEESTTLRTLPEDHKWFDPECGANGCQSLIWKGRYESAVKGRKEFRQAYRAAKADRDKAEGV